MPRAYAPFNIQNIGDKLYVTYAQIDHKSPSDESDHGAGFVDVFDMSGNLKEWTGTEVDTDAYRVRGGSYDNVKQGLTCEFDFIAFDEDVEFPNLGFRCCSATP